MRFSAKMIRQPVTKVLIEKANEPLDTKLKYFELMPLTDKSITINEKCNGCGTCTKSNAIQHWSRPEGVKYHHPEVKLSDMY